jgi:low affinity Fe/Cu permease
MAKRTSTQPAQEEIELLPRTIDGMTRAFGHPAAVAIAMLIVLLWVVGLPFAGFSNQVYQLLINTGTTIVTFVMVFAIQHTTNKETRAIMVKLDEMIRAMPNASDSFIAIEDESEKEVEAKAAGVRATQRAR